MACLECLNCGEFHNESKCPVCGSTFCMWDEEPAGNCGSSDDEVVAVTGSDGWVWWIRPKTDGAEQMMITDVSGGLPWNSLDMGFWQKTPALSITAEEAQ